MYGVWVSALPGYDGYEVSISGSARYRESQLVAHVSSSPALQENANFVGLQPRASYCRRTASVVGSPICSAADRPAIELRKLWE